MARAEDGQAGRVVVSGEVVGWCVGDDRGSRREELTAAVVFRNMAAMFAQGAAKDKVFLYRCVHLLVASMERCLAVSTKM